MKLVSGLVTDAMLIGGAVAVAYGAWLASPAAGFVVGGAVLMAGGILRGRAELAGKRGDK